jgi:hypothetical protein
MDITELITMLTDGLPADQAAIVKASIERDAVKAKVGTIKAQKEYEAIQTQAAEAQLLKDQLDSVDEKGNPKGYRAWYNKYYAKIQENANAIDAFEKKHGAGSFVKASTGEVPQGDPVVGGLTTADVQKEAHKLIQETYAPRWSSILTQTGTVIQKHLLAGRKIAIPMEELGKSATEKFNGNLEAAYDEWDKPEREKMAKADTEAEISRRVAEELQKKQASAQFPGGLDVTPSSLTSRTKADLDKFDKTAMQQDLARTFMAGEYPKAS